MGHDSGPNRIQLNVPATGKKICFTVYQGRSIASFPQRSCPTIGFIDVAHVPTTQRLKRLGQTVILVGGDEEVHMVVHENIGVDSTPMMLGRLFKEV
jgi:hypothetical protein